MGDWYRRGTWSAADRADFAVRLDRVHSAAFKATYVRIQAARFQALGGRVLLEAALELLDRLVVEFPGSAGGSPHGFAVPGLLRSPAAATRPAQFPDPAQISAAHQQRAECLVALGERLRAIGAYRLALDVQRQMPQLRSDAFIGFGELVLELQRVDLYGEVLAALHEFGAGEWDTEEEFRIATIRAFVCDAGGLRKEARACARRALAAVPRLGGVRQPTVETRLQSLATSTLQ